MLIINRKLGERILISDKLWLKVEKIQKSQVVLSFDGSKEVVILREELVTNGPNA